jgi:hypothetical protein
MEIQWFKVRTSRLKKHQRIVGCSDDGEVYFPASLYGGEMRNMLAMSFDGIGGVLYENHLFSPVSWLKNEFPQDADAINAAVVNIRGMAT